MIQTQDNSLNRFSAETKDDSDADESSDDDEVPICYNIKEIDLRKGNYNNKNNAAKPVSEATLIETREMLEAMREQDRINADKDSMFMDLDFSIEDTSVGISRTQRSIYLNIRNLCLFI